MRKSLLNMMAWLEENVGAVSSALPPQRDLSFLEVSLYCLVKHLEFRSVLPMEDAVDARASGAHGGGRSCARA